MSAGDIEIKAAVCREFGAPLNIERLRLAAPGPGEVRVRIAACAICHSDISYLDGAWGGETPFVLGHEAAGVVEEVGGGVEGLAAGARVVVTLIRSCGDCVQCAQGKPYLCEHTFALDRQSPLRGADGETIGQGLRTAAFADHVTVHQSQAVRVDDGLPHDAASLLACGVITGLGAVSNTAKVPAGASVAVIGCGGVGLNSVQGAALNGADPIIGLDIEGGKLEAALVFGATETVDAADANAVEKVRALTNGRGVDYAFVAVGAPQAMEQGIAMLARGGMLVVVGMPPSGAVATFDPGDIAGWGQNILGSKMGSTRPERDIPGLVALYAQGRLKLDELISGRYPLEDVNEAIAEVKRGGALRNVIIFEEG